MRKLAAILCLAFACLSARAAYTTVSLTITNTPTNGYTVTINGNVRTWTNTVSSAGTQIQNTNSIGACVTNLFNQLLSSPIASVQVHSLGTNAVTFSSLSALTVTVSTNWATLTNTAITTTNGTGVIVPFTQYPPADAVTVASQLVTGLENSTTALAASSPVLTNHMALSTVQTITGAKVFSGANVYSNTAQVFSGGTITNSILSNCVPALTNGYASNLILTNGVNRGNPFRSPGGGIGSEQFGTSASAANDGDLAVGNTATANGFNATSLGTATTSTNGSTAVGTSASAYGVNSIAVGNGAAAHSTGGISIGQNSDSGADYAIALGYLSSTPYTNSIAIGPSAITDQAFQIKLGTASYSVSIPGTLQVDGGISNAVFVGSLKLNNELIVASFNNTSLATNNSAVNISTNSYVTIAAGPAAAFAIHGIAGGVNGRVVTIENTTGFSMTLVPDSGVDATAANRIKTGTGANLLIANNPGTVTLRYNGTLSEWVVVSKN